MKKEEWVDYFQQINGRKPTPQEFTTAMKAGEFDSVTGSRNGLQENQYNNVQKQQNNAQNTSAVNMQPQPVYQQTNTQAMSGIQRQGIGISGNTVNTMQQQYANSQQNIYINNQNVPKNIQLIGPAGDVIKCSTGFSFSVYFFALIVSISRGDWLWVVRWTIYGILNLLAIGLILTNPPAGLLLMISITVICVLGVMGYNRYYIVKLLKNGYVPFSQADQMGLAILQRKGMLK
jgi:hypothetical protein